MSERRKSVPSVAPWDKSNLTGSNHKARKDTTRVTKGKFLCFVTGAGYGLGRAVAGLAFQNEGILPNALSGSRVVLVDKDEDALKETSGKKMRQFLKHRKIDVQLEVVDLVSLEETRNLVVRMESKIDKDYEHVIFVNNTFTLSDSSKKLSELEGPMLSDYWNINITTRMFMTTQFCRIFCASKRTIVHTVSYESASPIPYLGPSCMAAGAIEMFAKIFAKENPEIRILHFRVGALDTDQTQQLIESCGNYDLQEELIRLRDENKLQAPLEPAKRMIKYIEGDDFEYGEVQFVDDNKESLV